MLITALFISIQLKLNIPSQALGSPSELVWPHWDLWQEVSFLHSGVFVTDTCARAQSTSLEDAGPLHSEQAFHLTVGSSLAYLRRVVCFRRKESYEEVTGIVYCLLAVIFE